MRKSSKTKNRKKPKILSELPFKTFGEMLKYADFSWEQLELVAEGGVILNFEYPLNPGFFLECAADDLKVAGQRGLINALSNAKRAMDCQTDSFISSIGLSPQNLKKQIGKVGMENLRLFTTDCNQPVTYQVLESFGIATPSIVRRVRKIRNLLEHEYKKVSRQFVQDASEIATLYVKACKGAMATFLEDVEIGVGRAKHSFDGSVAFERRICIRSEYGSPAHLTLHYNDFKRLEQATLQIRPVDPSYLDLLRVLFLVRENKKIELSIATAARGAGISMEGIKVGIKSIHYGWIGG